MAFVAEIEEKMVQPPPRQHHDGCYKMGRSGTPAFLTRDTKRVLRAERRYRQ